MAITLDGSNVNTVGVINSKTAVASTSGTSIDFTGIPSGVKRITVMFNGVSTNGTSLVQVQLGAGSITTTSYVGEVGQIQNGGTSATTAYSSGFIVEAGANAAATRYGSMIFSLLGSNTWVCQGVVARGDSTNPSITAGGLALGGTLDRVRITTVNGTDTFDDGSINILYE